MLIALTPTGGRPDAWLLCELWMAHQTRKPDLWIVIDDCKPRTKTTMDQLVIVPDEPWTDGESTQRRNILAALDAIEQDIPGDHQILFIEDDDHIAPDYIEKQAARLDHHEMVGEQPARYYHVRHSAYHEFGPTPHASLAATAVRSSMMPAVREACGMEQYIDMYLWWRHGKDGMLYADRSVTGIKGMPGRPGVSDAHRRERSGYWTPDTSGAKLREWIGADAAYYAKFLGGAPAAPAFPIYENPDGFETFMFMGQQRFRCPERANGCPWDGVSPAAVHKHIKNSHAATDEAPTGNTLFEDESVQIPKSKIIIARS